MLMEPKEKKSLEEIKQEPYTLMDRYDEDEMLAELEGKYLKGMVYQFEQTLPNGSKQTVTGLSYTGIKEAAHKFAMATKQPIDILEEILTEDQSHYTLKVKARHPTVGSRWGVAKQTKHFDSGATDKFALQKVYSKAQRNAMRQILPEHSIQTFIDAAIAAGDVKKVAGLTSTGFSRDGELLIKGMMANFSLSREQVLTAHKQNTAGKSYSELGGLKSTQKVLTKAAAGEPKPRKIVEADVKVVEEDQPATSRCKSGSLYKGDDSGLIGVNLPFPTAIVEAVDKIEKKPDDFGLEELKLALYEDDLVLAMRKFPHTHWKLCNTAFKAQELGLVWCVAKNSSHWFIPGGHPSILGPLPKPGDIAGEEDESEPEPPKKEPKKAAPKAKKAPKKKVEKKVKSSKKDKKPDTEEAPKKVTVATKDGTEVGVITYFSDNRARFDTSTELGISRGTAPWESFLIERVLDAMVNVDLSAVRNGALDESKQFEYFTDYEDSGLIKGISFVNLVEDRRRREVESSMRWTIEKMLSKMR